MNLVALLGQPKYLVGILTVLALTSGFSPLTVGQQAQEVSNQPVTDSSGEVSKPITRFNDTEGSIQFTKLELSNLALIYDAKKLSAEVNLIFHKQFAFPLFQRIADKDNRQLAAIRAFAVKHQIKEPVLSSDAGVFTSKEVSDRKKPLIAQGTDQLEAVRACTELQELQILTIEKARQQSTEKAYITFLKSVLDSTKLNLRNYVGALKKLNNEKYTPRHLQQAEFDSIMQPEGARKDRKPLKRTP